MKQSELHRPYDLIMSLGYNCMVAYQLKRLSLRSFSGPVDWVIIDDANQLVRLLDNRFSGYMEEHNLRILGTHNGFYSVLDTEYQAKSFHDFPVIGEKRVLTNYREFQEKRDRRINHFMNAAAHSDSALFIRERCSYEDAINLKKSLSSLVKGTVHLLILNYTDKDHMVENNWKEDGICSVEVISSDTKEHIRDPYWNDALRGVSFVKK